MLVNQVAAAHQARALHRQVGPFRERLCRRRDSPFTILPLPEATFRQHVTGRRVSGSGSSRYLQIFLPLIQ